MFKKVLLILSVLCLFGCSKNSPNNIVKDLSKKVIKSSSYNIKGTLDLYSDIDTYNYDIEVTYLKDDYYIVSLLNNNNNKNQVILKNNEGLYVITPALNKSFKFDSNWPDNSSQIYILKSIINDINNDNELIINKSKKYIQSKVVYPNNSEIAYQRVHYDKNYNINCIEIYDNKDNIKMKFNISTYDLKYNANKKDFDLSKFITNTSVNETEDVLSTLDDAMYPLFIPSNTYLNSTQTIKTEDENRIILTFSGEKNFVIVEEALKPNKEMEIIPIFGSPVLINDSVAALSNNSIYWQNNDINYYLASEDLSEEQMVFIASSIGNTTTVIAQK